MSDEANAWILIIDFYKIFPFKKADVVEIEIKKDQIDWNGAWNNKLLNE